MRNLEHSIRDLVALESCGFDGGGGPTEVCEPFGLLPGVRTIQGHARCTGSASPEKSFFESNSSRSFVLVKPKDIRAGRSQRTGKRNGEFKDKSLRKSAERNRELSKMTKFAFGKKNTKVGSSSSLARPTKPKKPLMQNVFAVDNNVPPLRADKSLNFRHNRGDEFHIVIESHESLKAKGRRSAGRETAL